MAGVQFTKQRQFEPESKMGYTHEGCGRCQWLLHKDSSAGLLQVTSSILISSYGTQCSSQGKAACLGNAKSQVPGPQIQFIVLGLGLDGLALLTSEMPHPKSI